MKFKKILLCICMVLCVCLGLAACGEVFKTGPSTNAAVIGNGGLAVMKGEYIYFVNGYNSASDNYQQNKGDKIYYSAIYRVKAENASYEITTSNGVSTVSFNEGSLPECDENGNLPGAERLVSKVGGFENTALYIFDDYLYFTTHTNSINLSSDQVNTAGVEIYRINLNGKDLKKLYTLSTFSEKGQVNFYKNGNNVYGVFYDGSNKLAVYRGTKQVFEKEKVSSLAMPYFSTYSPSVNNASEQTLFYIEDGKLNSYVVGGETSEIETSSVPTALGAVANKRLFYTQDGALKFIEFGFSSFDAGSNLRVVSRQNITSFIVMNTERVQVVAKTASGIDILKFREGENPEIVRLSSNTNATLIGINGETVFYADKTADSEAIYMAREFLAETKVNGSNKVVAKGNKFASVTGKYVYFYTEFTNKEGSSTYLARVDVSNPSGEMNVDYVCARLKKDYIDKE